MTTEETIIELRRKIADLIEYKGLDFETIYLEMLRTYGVDITDKLKPATWNAIIIILRNWSKGLINVAN